MIRNKNGDIEMNTLFKEYNFNGYKHIKCFDGSDPRVWIVPRGVKDKLGHKYDLIVNYENGIPLYILDKQKEDWLKTGAITETHLRMFKLSDKTRRTQKMPVKNMSIAKKLAKKIIAYYDSYKVYKEIENSKSV